MDSHSPCVSSTSTTKGIGLLLHSPISLEENQMDIENSLSPSSIVITTDKDKNVNSIDETKNRNSVVDQEEVDQEDRFVTSNVEGSFDISKDDKDTCDTTKGVMNGIDDKVVVYDTRKDFSANGHPVEGHDFMESVVPDCEIVDTSSDLVTPTVLTNLGIESSQSFETDSSLSDMPTVINNSNLSILSDQQKLTKTSGSKKKQDNVLKVRSVPPTFSECIQCNKTWPCNFMLELSGNKKGYLCSANCAFNNKIAQRLSLKRSFDKSVSVIGNNVPRRCGQCRSSEVFMDALLSWEAMDFCNEDCLKLYLSKLPKTCASCNKICLEQSIGKYCVRFGFVIKQFCNFSCLEDFKTKRKVCSFCKEDISNDPIGTMTGQKDLEGFCNEICMKKFNSISQNQPISLSVEKCAVCSKNKVVTIEVLKGKEKFSLCSDVCFSAFKFVHPVTLGFCDTCKMYFDIKSSPESYYTFYDGTPQTFCSKLCMNIHIMSKRKIVQCNWCKVKKYNFDMIQQMFSNKQVMMLCSFHCYTMWKNSPKRSACDNCNLFSGIQFHLGMSDGTLRSFCCHDCLMNFQMQFKKTPVTPSNSNLPAQTTPSSTSLPPLVPASTAVPPVLTSSAKPAIRPREDCSTIQTLSVIPSLGMVPETVDPAFCNNPIQFALSSSPSRRSKNQNAVAKKSTTPISPKRPSPPQAASVPPSQTALGTKHQLLIAPPPVPEVANKSTTASLKPKGRNKAIFVKPNSISADSQTDTVTTESIAQSIKEIGEALPVEDLEKELSLLLDSIEELKRRKGLLLSSSKDSSNKSDPPLTPASAQDMAGPESERTSKMSEGSETNMDEQEDINTEESETEKKKLDEGADEVGNEAGETRNRESERNPEDIETAESEIQAKELKGDLGEDSEDVGTEERETRNTGSERDMDVGSEDNETEESLTRSRGSKRDLEDEEPEDVGTEGSSASKRQRLDEGSCSIGSSQQGRGRADRTALGGGGQGGEGDGTPPAPRGSPPLVPITYNKYLKHMLGVNAWKKWVGRKNEEILAGNEPRLMKPFNTDLLQLSSEERSLSLCFFVTEIRKPSGEQYEPDTIYYLCLGIQQYLQMNGRIENIFIDSYYDNFTSELNEIVKKFHSFYSDSEFLVPRIEEEHLWESRQLGAHSPHILLHTLLFFNTKYFLLDSEEAHSKLSFSHIMKHWKRGTNGDGVSVCKNVLIRYYPLNQAPQGKLTASGAGSKETSFSCDSKKNLEQHEDPRNPARCPIKHYDFYLSKCPESMKTRSDVFYLRPERSCVMDSPVWFSTEPMDINSLSKMINRLKLVQEIYLALLPPSD